MIRLSYPDIRYEEVRSSIENIIRSGYLTKGKYTEQFENDAAGYLGVKYAVAVSSGTAALHLALLALGIGDGDEVIVPDYTFVATANAVELCGAETVFTDIEQGGFNITPEQIEEKITGRTKAVIPVHQFGFPADMSGIMNVAKRKGLLVIEDAACAFGAGYDGDFCGAIGDVGCFSFHPRKILTTGEGGMVVTNNRKVAEKIRSFREHGVSFSGAKRRFSHIGYNYRIDEMSAALGAAQIKKCNKIKARRKALFYEYAEMFKGIDDITVMPVGVLYAAKPVYQTFVVRINKTININDLLAGLRSDGVEASISNYSLHEQPYYKKKYGFNNNQFRNSSGLSKHCIALPLHWRLTGKDIKKVVKAVRKILT